jgi:hypothetical protein
MERSGSFVGDPINVRRMVYGPVNDQGVFALCMAMLEDLHLQVEEIPAEGPFCTVRRPTRRGWKRVTLAYAYKSSGLQTHEASLPADAVMVCWEHDWLACPWEVIELRLVVRELTRTPADPHDPPRFDDYLQRQPEPIRRLFRRLDHGIRGLASEVGARTTKGRKSAGGVSYYALAQRFCCLDFHPTGRGLTVSVFTGGHHWEGVNPSVSDPWGFLQVRREADVPKAMALAKAAYEARMQTVPPPRLASKGASPRVP